MARHAQWVAALTGKGFRGVRGAKMFCIRPCERVINHQLKGCGGSASGVEEFTLYLPSILILFTVNSFMPECVVVTVGGG